MEDTNKLLPEGTLLRSGTYRVEHSLGSGGFGNTYLVHHIGLDAKMVVKEFFMKGINLRDEGNTVMVSVPDNRATFESQRAKFKKEAQRLWKLKSEHIVGVHDIFEENGTAYYVMDFIEGESLDARLKREGSPLQEGEVSDILNQLLDALSAIHNNKPVPIFHLDIKPGNILLGHDGKVVLIDFGASKQLSGDREGVTSTMMTYTKGYAPTEQMDSRPEFIGAWTDLYALGATLYKLLTASQPPEPSDIISEETEAFLFPATISEKVQSLIVWLMQPNRKKRPQSVEEVLEWLNNTSKQNQPNAAESFGTKPVSEETTFLISSQPIVEEHPVKSSIGLGHRMESGESGYDSKELTITANGVSFKMIRVEGGTFTMGATPEQGSDADNDEKPAHQVTLSTYYIGETEVTQALWQAVMGSNPSNFKGANRPVEQVSWDDCKTFISKLNAITGRNFRLPTEAEWEFAARGGNMSRGYKYSGSNTLEEVGWYYENSGTSRLDDSSWDYDKLESNGSCTHPVKQKKPNELGLYGMSGNVDEWCQDWYGKDYYSASSQTNPTGPSSGSSRVYRGGGWHNGARGCRVSLRYSNSPVNRFCNLGLRLVL